MKLIIQIPCFNEEHTLPQTYADLPKQIDGIDLIEVLVIDDGSTDATTRVAREIGVDHIVRHGGNRGLAAAFSTGIRACLQRDADIIVNTDADNQYCGADIRRLIQPLLAARASIVVGDRQTDRVAHFSRSKKWLQRLGSWVVRRLSGTDLNDAVSGFRAFSRAAAMQLNVVTSFSYTVETLIQAGARGIPVTSVPVRTNPSTRESRLFHSTSQFISRQLATMLRSYLMYHPGRTFLGIAVIFALAAFVALVVQVSGLDGGSGMTLVLFAVLMAGSVFSVLLALIGDLLRNSRRLIEMTLTTARQIENNEVLCQPLISGAPAVVPFERPTGFPEPAEADSAVVEV